jgi:hypothetical protein
MQPNSRTPSPASPPARRENGPDAIVFDRKNKTLSPADSTTKASTKHEAKTTRDRNILEQNWPQEFRNEGVRVGPPIEILTDSVTGEFKLSRGK